MKKWLIVLGCLIIAGCATFPVVKDEEMVREFTRLEKEKELYRLEQEKRINTMGPELLALFPKPLPIKFEYDRSPEVNAYATHNKVVVFEGLLAYTESDDELGSVMAHEIAHCVMEHERKRAWVTVPFWLIALGLTGTAGVDMFPLAQAATNPYERSQEKEADFIGTILAYQAGYDPKALPKFNERMAIRLGDTSINRYGRTHPPTPYRVALIKKTVKALEDKELIPEILWVLLLKDVDLPKNKYSLEQLLSTVKFMGYEYKQSASLVEIKAPSGRVEFEINDNLISLKMRRD